MQRAGREQRRVQNVSRGGMSEKSAQDGSGRTRSARPAADGCVVYDYSLYLT